MRTPQPAVTKAKALRRRMTPPEVRLWLQLRIREPGLPAFRRQHPVGPYVLDFYCAKARLCIEVDGAIHGHNQAHDERRDAYLRNLGIRVERISARHVLESPNWAAMFIRNLAQEIVAGAPPPSAR